jgi:hypothetical protein
MSPHSLNFPYHTPYFAGSGTPHCIPYHTTIFIFNPTTLNIQTFNPTIFIFIFLKLELHKILHLNI